MKCILVTFVSVSVLWCGDALAHQDGYFPIDEHGNIERLAEEFNPASIVVWSRTMGPPEVTLTLSGKTVRLPDCLANLFFPPEGRKLTAHGSWWHDESRPGSLPAYIVINGADIGLMFNLHTAELVEAWNSERQLSTFCSDAELGVIPFYRLQELPEPPGYLAARENQSDKPHTLGEHVMAAIWCMLAAVAYLRLGTIILALLSTACRRRSM